MTLRRWAISSFPFKSLVDGVSNFWTASASGINEYYYNQPIFDHIPNNLLINGLEVVQSVNALGSLAAGEWAWGDNDTLGNNTIYVRLADGLDPDTKTFGHIECSEPLELLVSRMQETVLLSLQVASYLGGTANLIFFHVDGKDNILHRWARAVEVSPFDFEAKTVLEPGDRLLIMSDLEDVSVVASGDEKGVMIVRPENVSPAHKAEEVSDPPVLTANEFSTSDEHFDIHDKSQFVVTDQVTGVEAYDSGAVDAAITHVLGAGIGGGLYGWKARYKGKKHPGIWSPYSRETLFSISPDIVFAGGTDGKIYALNADDMSLVATYESFTGAIAKMCFGGDGFLYASSGSEVRKINPATMIQVGTAFIAGNNIKAIVWCGSVEDGLLYIGSQDSYVYKVDPADMTEVARLNISGAGIEALAYNGNDLLYVNNWENVQAINLSTFLLGGNIFEIGFGADVWSMAYGPDGKLYVAGGSGDDIYKVDPADMTLVAGQIFTPHTSNVKKMVFDEEGNLYSCSFDKKVYKIDPADLTQVALATYAGHNGQVYSIAYKKGNLFSAAAYDDNAVHKLQVTDMTKVDDFIVAGVHFLVLETN